jgi:hypothetical protein
MLQAGRSRARFPINLLDFSVHIIFSSLIMALGSTQPLTEMSTRNTPGSKGRLAFKTDLTDICEPIFKKMWEPRRVTTSCASTVYHNDSFTFNNFYTLYKHKLLRTKVQISALVPAENNFFENNRCCAPGDIQPVSGHEAAPLAGGASVRFTVQLQCVRMQNGVELSECFFLLLTNLF